MKKKIKRNIQDIIQTMFDAHNHVLRMLQTKKISESMNVLSQCQDCALHIGETIESSEGMNTQAVTHLEAYCEQLYKMSRVLDGKTLSQMKKELDFQLKCVKKELEEKIPTDILKIVFMPYKASMWDCLESIWESAEADIKCKTYVVPIPYYQRDIRGDMQEFCYEGALFPKYVPVIHYSNFSLERERPDVLYIHNPYDGANYVTSVHPDYYSSNLKKYVDTLVYIPYYISGNTGLPESHLQLSAYQYVDKIIVQNEENKKSLLKYVPEKKIEVIGTPKVDYLQKLEKNVQEINEHKIPKEWKRKIEGKKVILFNVSISGILQHSDVALDKIRYILSEFDNQENLVLMWRPHPLLEATLKSMRPEMYSEYMKIKKDFIHKNQGIFDETADAGVAAVVADAYVGEDSSSLIHYFGVLGKPILLTNWNILKDWREWRGCLGGCAFYIEGDCLYFIPSNKDFAKDLYQLNLENGSMEKVVSFPGTFDNIDWKYCGIKKIDNKFILIPYNAEDIYIYNLDNKQAMKIVLSEVEYMLDSGKGKMLFDKVEAYEDKLFCFPKFYPAIVSINFRSFEICEYKEFDKVFLSDKNLQSQLFTGAYVRRNQYVYKASCKESKMLIFNMDECSFEIKDIGNYTYGYGHMVYDGENFWLSAYDTNSVIRWNESTNETIEYQFPVVSGYEAQSIVSNLINMENEIIVCYRYCVQMAVIDKKSGKCREHTLCGRILQEMKKKSFGDVGGLIVIDQSEGDVVLIFNERNATLYFWHIKKNQWKSYPLRITRKEMLKTEKRLMETVFLERTTPYHIKETQRTILQFMDYIQGESIDAFKQNYACYYGREQKNTIGKQIHDYITI